MAEPIASELRKELAGETLFDGVSFSVGRRDRLSLAGPNGAGKTTSFRALAGETSLQGGTLAFAKGTRVVLPDQRQPLDVDVTSNEYALSGARDLLAAERDLHRLERPLAEGAHDQPTLPRYAEAHARLEHAGGWAWRERAAATMRGLGFVDEDLARPLGTFSGGELTRASLARSLGANPALLLLDEPTSHLGLENLEWLEQVLETLDAAVILVAHHRWLLEAVTTSVLELAPRSVRFLSGPWHARRPEKAARAAAAGRTEQRACEDIARLERFVERFRYRKGKAEQAQAKLTQFGRLEKERAAAHAELEALTTRRRTLGLDLLQPTRSGRVVLEASDVVLSAGDELLFDGASLVIERGGKVGLQGPDGAGKTTLLAVTLGRHPLDGGSVRLGHDVVPAAFSQHAHELPDQGSVLDATMRATSLSRTQAQALLGRLLVTGWELHERRVGTVSDGERRRLALALLVAAGASFLPLDAPANHLDVESREALETALEPFPGTVPIVSHHRALLDAVPDRMVADEERALRSYEGGWADLVRELEIASAPSTAPDGPPPELERAPRRKTLRPRPSELEQVENRIAEIGLRVAELEAKLAEEWTNMDVLAAHRAARDELSALLQRWEELFDAAQRSTP